MEKEYGKCENCGKTFIKKKKNAKYCSQECKRQKGNKRIRRYKAKCANCGKELLRSRNVTSKEPLRFCNAKCASEYRNKNNDKRKCVICGESFIPNKKNHLCCSRECKDKYTFFQKEQKCVICGEKFNAYTKRTTCCKECETKLHKKRVIENFKNGKYPKTLTKIHKKVNEFLKELNISYENEKPFGKYIIDIYLENCNLCIEVMGGYWHCDSRRDKQNLSNNSKEKIQRDKSKKEFIEQNYGIHILYLWEEDINNSPEKCKRLILLFIKHKGILVNYHSSSYNYNKRLSYSAKNKKQYIEL